MHTTKTLNYKNILAEIAEERGLTELAQYITNFSFDKVEVKTIPTQTVYNITKYPEAECSGCQ
jgi:hypothetical protein